MTISRFGRCAAMAMVLVVSGCDKVTKENFDKVQSGMTVAEVESILGGGTEQAGVGGAIGNLAGSAKVVQWEKKGKKITVTFANDKVVMKVQEGL